MSDFISLIHAVAINIPSDHILLATLEKLYGYCRAN